MSNISKSVLDKIKKEELKPKPRWRFVAGHVVMWGVIVFSIFVGSLAMGVLLAEIFGTEWEQVHRLGRDGIPGFILVLPYVWFATLGLTLLISYYLFAHTRKGYRHQPFAIVGATALISVLLGTGLYLSRTAERFEQELIDRVPPYAQMQMHRMKMWVAPEHGVLAGKIMRVAGKRMIIVNDLTGKRWEVDIREARYRPGILEVGVGVLVVGEKTGVGTFDAEEILPHNQRLLNGVRRLLENRERKPAPGV